MPVNAPIEPDTSRQNITFTFREFRKDCIHIPGVFNNYVLDEADFSGKLSSFVFFALPLFSQHCYRDLLDRSMGDQLHFHQIRDDQLDVVKQILKAYHFRDERIDSIVEGNCLYQFSSELNTGMRVVAEKRGSLFSVLFFDANHHIYMNKALTQESGSLFYEHCPRNVQGKCATMPDTCYAFEYLDIQKLHDSLGIPG